MRNARNDDDLASSLVTIVLKLSRNLFICSMSSRQITTILNDVLSRRRKATLVNRPKTTYTTPSIDDKAKLKRPNAKLDAGLTQ